MYVQFENKRCIRKSRSKTDTRPLSGDMSKRFVAKKEFLDVNRPRHFCYQKSRKETIRELMSAAVKAVTARGICF
jgi:hypothetical protein